MSYETVLFDLDGTLTDSAPGITRCVRHALASIGAAEIDDDRVLQFVGPPLQGSFETLCALAPADAKRAVKHYRDRYTDIGIFENSVYPGVPELLKELRENGKTLILATSKPTIYAEQILKHFDLFDWFDQIMGSEMDGTRTSKSDVIAAVLEDFAADQKKSAVMVGDREHDILGARLNQIDSIGVAYGYGSIAELRAAKPDWIAHSLEELQGILSDRRGERFRPNFEDN